MYQNPFYTRELPLNAPFCNRVKELNELTRHAQNKMNIVLFSPRRYGKTSLIKRVLSRLSKSGTITVYADMYGVTSQEDIADRIAKAIYEKVVKQENVEAGLKDFFEDEKPYYEMMIAQLSAQQIKLVTALAKEPTKTPYGNEYIFSHKLGSLSAIQGGIKKLVSVDYIDKQTGYYEVVDPLFKMWLIDTQN